MVAAWVVALLESVGAGFLVLGLATRLVALGLAVDMLVAIRDRPDWEGEGAVRVDAAGTGLGIRVRADGRRARARLPGAGRLSIDALIGL